MTDKTDALLALAGDLREYAEGCSASYLKQMAGRIEALAAQPAGDAHYVAEGRGYWQIAVEGKPYNFRNPPGFKLVPDTTPPAASVDVEGLAKDARWLLEIIDMHPGRTEYSLNTQAVMREVENKLALIDSAGGAKGECRHEWINSDGVGGKARKNLHCAKCGKSRDTMTPQPDGGDGAEIEMPPLPQGKAACEVYNWTVVYTAEQMKAYGLACTRPSAAAAVPEGFVLVPTWKLRRAADIVNRDGDEHGVGADIEAMLAAAPAAPTAQASAGAVSPKCMVALRDYQQADQEGSMVTVSRQALDEAIDALAQQPAAADELGLMFGAMLEADFEKNTVTFEMRGDYACAAGLYEIRPNKPSQEAPRE